ncbi:MAG: hypothetical protein IJZ72_06365 [Oscillospiraceae bacterium]|nr:hypothetical protein [Oscillospiraceae bacterium]
MHKLKEKLMDELRECEEKAKKSGYKMSQGELQYIHTLTDIIKNIDKIEMLEDVGEYSQADGNSYDNGNSYANRRGSTYVRGYYRGGRRGYSRDNYSQEGNYSRDDAKEEMIEKLDEMLEIVENPRERNAIMSAIKTLENS